MLILSHNSSASVHRLPFRFTGHRALGGSQEAQPAQLRNIRGEFETPLLPCYRGPRMQSIERHNLAVTRTDPNHLLFLYQDLSMHLQQHIPELNALAC